MSEQFRQRLLLLGVSAVACGDNTTVSEQSSLRVPAGEPCPSEAQARSGLSKTRGLKEGCHTCELVEIKSIQLTGTTPRTTCCYPLSAACSDASGKPVDDAWFAGDNVRCISEDGENSCRSAEVAAAELAKRMSSWGVLCQEPIGVGEPARSAETICSYSLVVEYDCSGPLIPTGCGRPLLDQGGRLRRSPLWGRRDWV